jgi:hypothetical protein
MCPRCSVGARTEKNGRSKWSATSTANGSSKLRAARNVHTFGDLIDLHDEDMHEVGKPPRRSKAAVMAALKTELGSVKLPALNRNDSWSFKKVSEE